jgi:glycosyltransferase involved in cell wall biosynthesis
VHCSQITKSYGECGLIPLLRIRRLAITSVSKTEAASLQEYIRRPVSYLPNGIPSEFGYVHEPKVIRDFGIRPDNYFLFVGRLVPGKGVEYLIEAFRRLDTKRNLVITGAADHSNAYSNRLRALAKGDPRILFPGFVPREHIFSFYEFSYGVVLPSEIVANSLALLETLAMGQATLCSGKPVYRSVAEDSALYFTSCDVDDLEIKLRIFEEERDQIKKQSENFRDRPLKAYNWKTIALRYENLYEQLFMKT